MNLPERRVEPQSSPAEPESNITELRPADRAARLSVEVRSSLFTPPAAQTGPDPAFWIELNATIDEFFTMIAQSRARIAELSSEVAKRDAMITLLEAQNGSLKARLGIADSPPPSNGATAKPETSATPAPRTGIWGKLANLERDGA